MIVLAKAIVALGPVGWPETIWATREVGVECVQDTDVLVQELTHRFFNSLQIIDCLLGGLSRKTQTLETLAHDLGKLRRRVSALSELHRKLAFSHGLGGQLEEHCRSICLDLVRTFGREDIDTLICVDNIHLSPVEEQKLVLLMVELVTNALKHNRSEVGSTIWVDLSRSQLGLFELRVRDNGLQRAEPGSLPRIASALARSLGGELQVSVADGYSARVTLSSGDSASPFSASPCMAT